MTARHNFSLCRFLPSPKGAEPPIFGPSSLWPNGWMHQDTTWYGGRPQPRRLCVRWGPSLLPQKRWRGPSPLPQKGKSPTQFSAHVCCGPTDAWIKMPLGTEVGLGPTLCSMWIQLPPEKGHTHPTQFLAHVCCGQMAG